MRRRPRPADKMPELMISPMLDLIFLLLAFFIISTMYMTEVRTISIALPAAQNAEVVHKSSSLVTVKKMAVTGWMIKKCRWTRLWRR